MEKEIPEHKNNFQRKRKNLANDEKNKMNENQMNFSWRSLQFITEYNI